MPTPTDFEYGFFALCIVILSLVFLVLVYNIYKRRKQ